MSSNLKRCFDVSLLYPNPPWHVTVLDEETVERILNAIPKVLVQTHIANYCGIPHQRLSDWIKFGKRDMEKGRKNSIFADFLQKYNEKRAQVLCEKLAKLELCPKNYGAITWILERTYREEFAPQSESEKQLHHLVFDVIAPMMQKEGINVERLLALMPDKEEGEGHDGEEEVYPRSDKTAGRPAPGIKGAKRPENP